MKEAFTPEDAQHLLEDTNTFGEIGNRRTMPNTENYAHRQWLWDSVFIAIGYASFDPDRGAEEIESLLEAQWSNGMVPSMVYEPGQISFDERILWQEPFNKESPKGIFTSSITQPPIIATGARIVAENLPDEKRQSFLSRIYPKLVNYHEWLYDHRDLDGHGVVTALHPWETGTDSSSAVRRGMEQARVPLSDFQLTGRFMVKIAELTRRDTNFIDADQRIENEEGVRNWESAAWHRGSRKPTTEWLRDKKKFGLNNVLMNMILIRANEDLRWIAQEIDELLPEELLENMQKAQGVVDYFWDPLFERFHDRDAVGGLHIPSQSLSNIAPIIVPHLLLPEQCERIVAQLKDPTEFNAPFNFTTEARDSRAYNPRRFWNGSKWINWDWLLDGGLDEIGEVDIARENRELSIGIVETEGPYEYFSPEDGEPLGARGFSWTAALYLKMIDELNGR